MKLNNALKEKMLDVRLRDKWLADGKVSQAEVDKYLSELDDDSDKMEFLGSNNKAAAAEPASEESSDPQTF